MSADFGAWKTFLAEAYRRTRTRDRKGTDGVCADWEYGQVTNTDDTTGSEV